MDLARLARIVPTDLSLAERLAHARDLAPRDTLAVLAGRPPPLPAAVARPRDEDEVDAVLQWATAEGVPVVPWGAGSGVCGAAAARADGVTIDLKGLRTIGPLDPLRARVRVGAGVLGQHLEDWLAARGWATRHSPSSIACSTVGGWAVTRSAGQFSSKYGTFPDMVTGARAVAPAARYGAGSLHDGPCAAWGDADRLAWLLGTEGHLGVVTALEVAVVPLPTSRVLSGWRFESLEDAWGAMRASMQDGAAPFALRLYDPVDTRIAGKGTATRARGGSDWLRGALAAVDRVPALRRNALALPLALPGLLNRIARGVSSGCVLIAGWEGDDAASAAAAGEERLRAAGGAALGPEVGEHWYAHRHDVSYKLAPIFARGGYADTMEVAASWSGLGALYREVSEALARHALVMAHFSHAYREGCSIYFTFAGRGTPDAHARAWEDALEAAARAGGTVAHHHGVGTLKQRAAAVEMAAFATDYRRLSAALDPARVLNPGRLFPDVTVADAVEPAGPSIDAVSRTATLRGDQPGPERDAWLAGQGWALVYPTSGPVTDAIRGPRAPNASRILGGTVRVAGGVRAMPVAPRSSAGPDLRADLPREAYLWVVVPVERVG